MLRSDVAAKELWTPPQKRLYVFDTAPKAWPKLRLFAQLAGTGSRQTIPYQLTEIKTFPYLAAISLCLFRHA